MFKYLRNSIINLRNRQSHNGFGFSLVELVVAMGILMIIMPATVGIMKAATEYKEAALQHNSNLVHSSGFNAVFRGDVENAVAIKLESNNHIKLKVAKQNNSNNVSFVCKDWRIQDNILKSKTSSEKIPVDLNGLSTSSIYHWSNWSNILDDAPVKSGKSGKIFTYDENKVTYDIALGNEESMTNYTATIVPNSAASTSSPC